MSQVIVNLTLPIVVAKIESVLKNAAPENRWQVANGMDLRQRLTSYVLRRLPVMYVTLDQHSIRRMGTPSQCYSYDQHRQIDRLIQQGLQTLIEDGASPIPSSGEDELAARISPNYRRTQEPALVSDWFG
ncbi:MAG: hypothetical protein ACHWZW_07035 [Spirulina sp.]